MELGIHLTIPNEVYHSMNCLSSSKVKIALAGAKAYQDVVINKQVKEKDKTALDLGTLVHEFILEPHKIIENYYVYDGKMNANGTIPKKELDEIVTDTIITSKQALNFAQLAFDNCMNYDVSRELLFENMGINEATILSQNEELNIIESVRPDRLEINDGVIVDLKTARDASFYAFRKDVKYNFHYDLSAYMYTKNVSQLFGKTFRFIWIVIEKDSGNIAVYEVSEETMLEGKAKYDRAIEVIKKVNQTPTHKFLYQEQIQFM